MTPAASRPHEAPAAAAAGRILALNNIEVVYDRVILVLKGVSLEVKTGGIVALVGADGAGKTTTLKAISNLLHAERGEVTKGSILFDGAEVQSLSPNELVRRGCIPGMEGRHCGAPRPRAPLGLFPASARAPHRDRRLHLGRRAADVRARPRPDVAPEDDPAR